MSWWTPIATGIAAAQATAERLRVRAHESYREGSARDAGFAGERKRAGKRKKLRSEQRRVADTAAASKR